MSTDWAADAQGKSVMGIVAMTVVLIFSTVGAGYLLWSLMSHYEEISSAAEHEQEAPQPRGAALLFLTLGLFIAGTLAVLLVEVQQLFISVWS